MEIDYFSVFEVRVNGRGKIWKWSVCTDKGEIGMRALNAPDLLPCIRQTEPLSTVIVCALSFGSA
jgi:hypothetical protein